MRHDVRRRMSPAALSRQASAPRRGIQIGPRIRVGGSVGKIGQNVKKAITKGVTDVGHFAGTALSNPLVQAGLGVLTGGLTIPVLAGAAGGILRPGGNFGTAAMGGLTGAAAGGAGKLVRGIIPAVGGASPAATGIGLGGGDIAAAGAAPAARGLLSGGVGGLLRSGATWALHNPGTLLTAAQGVSSAMDAAHARALENKALDYATSDWNARAPLREAGMAGLLNPTATDLSSVYATNPGNPYAVVAQKPVRSIATDKTARRIRGVTRRQAMS